MIIEDVGRPRPRRRRTGADGLFGFYGKRTNSPVLKEVDAFSFPSMSRRMFFCWIFVNLKVHSVFSGETAKEVLIF